MRLPPVVAMLRSCGRRPGEDGLGQQRITPLDLVVVGDVGVRRQRPIRKPAVVGVGSIARERQAVMSTSRRGRSTFSFMRSRRFVPPAMNLRRRLLRDFADGGRRHRRRAL